MPVFLIAVMKTPVGTADRFDETNALTQHSQRAERLARNALTLSGQQL
jgi:hypothetical protein